MPGEAVLITRFCVFLRGACREITCTRNCSAPRRGISGFLQGWCSTSKKLGFQWPHAAFATIDSGLLSWGHVLFRRGNALTKEILLHLLHDGSLIFLACRVQPVFVEQHLAELRPPVPGFAGDVLVDSLAEFGVERGLVQTG